MEYAEMLARILNYSEFETDSETSLACLGVRKFQRNEQGNETALYLICNGFMMGEWTTDFSTNCIADSVERKKYAIQTALDKGYELFDVSIYFYS